MKVVLDENWHYDSDAFGKYIPLYHTPCDKIVDWYINAKHTAAQCVACKEIVPAHIKEKVKFIWGFDFGEHENRSE